MSVDLPAATGLVADLEELRRQLGKGAIQRAYVAIVTHMSGLRARFSAAHDDWAVSGLYQGYFDMTYFALFPPSLKARNLKLAIVFDYETFRFQVWLAARNRIVQRQYWALLKDRGWPPESLVEPAVGVDAIVAVDAADGLDLVDLDSVAARLAQATDALLHDLERFLDAHDPPSA